MTPRNETRIEESHLELLAEHGTQIALIGTVNLDANQIVGVLSFHEYDGTVVLQSGGLNAQVNRLDTYNYLLDYFGSPADVVYKKLKDIIEEQERSDSEIRFTWDLITGTDAVRNHADLKSELQTVVSAERLELDFDTEDESVGIIDTTNQEHDIIKEANEYRVGVPVDIMFHRGQTYLVGLTNEYARQIANGIHELQMEYKEGGHYEAAETAERVESKVLSAAPDTVAEHA